VLMCILSRLRDVRVELCCVEEKCFQITLFPKLNDDVDVHTKSCQTVENHEFRT